MRIRWWYSRRWIEQRGDVLRVWRGVRPVDAASFSLGFYAAALACGALPIAWFATSGPPQAWWMVGALVAAAVALGALARRARRFGPPTDVDLEARHVFAPDEHVPFAALAAIEVTSTSREGRFRVGRGRMTVREQVWELTLRGPDVSLTIATGPDRRGILAAARRLRDALALPITGEGTSADG